MKSFVSGTLIAGLIFSDYNQTNAASEHKTKQATTSNASKDRLEIQTLIRRALNWSQSRESIGLLPLAIDKKGKFYSGFDLARHNQNLEKLKATKLFATEFINNYNQIILTLNKRFKKGDYGKWLVGDLPGCDFATNADPWSGCQDVPYDKPNPFDFLQIEIIKLDGVKGDLNWKWGNLPHGTNSDWSKYKYRFRVVKENNQWKIAYLEGFDFKKSIKSSSDL